MAHLGRSTSPAPGPQGASNQRDPLRDGPLRYFAFTSDVGEAFKLFISRRLYLGSYAVVALYGALDTADKGRRAYEHTLLARQTEAQAQPQPEAGPAAQPCTPVLMGLPASAAAAAAACATCLPPPPASLYSSYAATASSASEQARYPTAVPVAAAVLDTALWHAAASLAIPGVMINRTVWAVRSLLSHPAAAARLHPRVAQLAPAAAGLALIPLAVHDIDAAVTRWMDARLRPHLPREALPATLP